MSGGRKHGDLVRPGDEFNREDWYFCAVCGGAHAVDVGACDGLRRPLEQVRKYAGPIARAVDDYLLMERKARAWDELEQRATSCEVTARDVLALRDAVVHPAHDSSAR